MCTKCLVMPQLSFDVGKLTGSLAQMLWPTSYQLQRHRSCTQLPQSACKQYH
jgi:hypothetical protein